MDSSMVSILYAVLIVLIFLVVALIAVFIMLKAKEKNNNGEEEQNNKQKQEVTTTVKSTTKIAKEYETKSVFDFMEFEDVKDNMIVQNKGKRFLMVVECQGVNYDLMSEVEKTSTEHGFATFLNTLREPIQIYIQTRTVNLEKNIQTYKERVGKIKDELNLKEYRLKQYMEQPYKNEKALKDKELEVLRDKNLYAYGRDIVADTERMSLNKNVLKKKYYIILKHFHESTTGEEDEVLLSEEEIREAAFSHLYTKASSIIRVLAGIGIVGKALNSYELVDLLYNAYNRDESEVFGIDKAIESGYNEIYIDAQSVIDKKIEALNREIEIRANEEAKEAVEQVIDEKNKELQDIEDNIDSIIEELAKKVIENEINNIPQKIKDEAMEKIDEKHQKKGERKTNGKEQTKESNRKRRAV